MRIGDGIAVMNHEKLLSSAHIAQREAHVVGMQIVGVLYDFNQSLEGLDVQVFGRRRGALQATFAALRRTKMRRSVRALEGINQPRIALAFPAALRSSSIFGFALSVIIVSAPPPFANPALLGRGAASSEYAVGDPNPFPLRAAPPVMPDF